MKLKQLFTEERAVSPVIGVILMVAITVILAAVIGAFVLNIGGNQEKVPQASFSFADNGAATNNIEVTHEGGEGVATGQITFTVNGADQTSPFGTDTSWTAGETFPVTAASGQTVNIVWGASSGSSSNIIGTYTVP
ncbi:type IV pilin N-terminal domain-containing protein [Haloarchaeobius sp. HME9146]|uniref:type IV pilin N-terminal domain-containing protein n=1 Tax=unclassified Haloarchaeobius TaxID=2614452 RepID=UPI0021BE5D63|nr:type IV pilin N-terminal domain-containing protein [Haloarchaeobius sp. HME9146]MCT9098497.1 type IV pilin N-terminal domain-containing protein [Haloarchaeobius sp. HME9146]